MEFRPISVYGATKAATECYLSAYSASYGITALSCRYSNIYGARLNKDVIFDLFMKLQRDSRKLEILGNDKQRKLFLYIKDCIDAIFSVIESFKEGFDAFNIASDNWIMVDKITNIICDILNLKDVDYTYTNDKGGWIGDVIKMLPSIEKIKNIGWKPKVKIEEGIELYIQWLKQKYKI